MPVMSRKAISEPSHSLDRDRGFVGVVKVRKAAQVHEIDWNSLLLGKKVLSEQELADAGVEAPRNSLESSPGTRTPRFSGVKHDDIPYAIEIPKPVQPHHGKFGDICFSGPGQLRNTKVNTAEVLPIKTLIAQDSNDAEHEKKRRSAPSVVARLMGLDTLPEKLSKGSSAKPPKASKSSHASRKDTKPHSSRPESNSRPPSPLHDVDIIKDFPLPKSRAPTDSDISEDKTKFDVLPFRAHPQERQLQEFKKQFMEKLAIQRYEPIAGAAGARDFEAKRKLLREKLSEAKQALAGGGDESRRLSSAQEKLMESKEFQDAIELLQTNKEFFKKFFPESNSLSFAGNKDPPEAECLSRRSFHLGDSYVEPLRHDETSRRSFHFGDFSKESRTSSFLDEPFKEASKRCFHIDDLAREPGKAFFNHPQGLFKNSSGRGPLQDEDRSLRDTRRSHHLFDDVTKEIRTHDDYPDSKHEDYQVSGQRYSASEQKTFMETRHKSPRANPMAEEVMILQKSSKVSGRDREVASWVTPDHNIGRCGSPKNFDAMKGCDSPSRIVLLKPGPGEITLLSPALDRNCSPHSYRVVRDCRGGLYEAREVILIDPKERFSPPRIEEQRYLREEHKDSRVDPRAIARDTVREARTNSTRELSRDRETGRDSLMPGHANPPRFSGSSCATRVSSLPKYGNGLMESMEERMFESDETMGSSFSLACLSRRHGIEEKSRSSSPTVRIPSPKSRSQETPLIPDKHSQKEGQLRRSPEKLNAVHHVTHYEELQRKGVIEVRTTLDQGHELTRAPIISKQRHYLPGKKSPAGNFLADPSQETLTRADGWRIGGVNMYSTTPSNDKFLKVESVYPSNQHQNGCIEGQEICPRDLFRTRSVPNAGALVGTKICSAEVLNRCGNSNSHFMVQERVEISEHLKEKKAEARQAFLLSRKKVAGFDMSVSGRSVSNHSRLVDNNVVQDTHGMTLGSVLPVQPYNVPLRTRPALEKSVPVEDSPRHGACNQKLIEALSQRMPQAAPGANNNLDTDELRQLAGCKQPEGSKCSKAWSIATETLDNGEGDGASETSVDKCGQPSPVSVLDSPFEVESTSPVELKELSPDIQDLWLRLQLLKLEGNERSAVLIESSKAKENLMPRNLVVRDTQNSLQSSESFSVDGDLEPQALQSQKGIQGLHCPEGRLEELLYVRNILVASGFADSGSYMIGMWHSPTQPLDPALYERMEDRYVHADRQVTLEHGNTKSNSCAHEMHVSSNRRFLFDVVNEVLLQILNPYLSYQPWIRASIPLRPVPADWQLVSAIWAEICSYFSPEGVEDYEALDFLMDRDVSKQATWVDSITTYEQIGLELEKSIFESLLEEIVHSIVLLE